MKSFSILAGAALLAMSGTALAQPGAGGARGERAQADVTRAEAAARADAMFQRLDLNRDGQVTREEARQAHQQMRAERLAQMTPEQRAQMEQRRAQWQERRGQRAERGEGRRGGGERRGARGERMFGEQGTITAEQFRARALERFDRMDANRDGVVTAAERQQARAEMRSRWQERRGGARR
jgi:hypothetical protein